MPRYLAKADLYVADVLIKSGQTFESDDVPGKNWELIGAPAKEPEPEAEAKAKADAEAKADSKAAAAAKGKAADTQKVNYKPTAGESGDK